MNIKERFPRTAKTKYILVTALFILAVTIFIFTNMKRQSALKIRRLISSTDDLRYNAVTISGGSTYGNGLIYSIDDNGIIIATASHVISEGSDITVTFCNKKESPASLLRQDPSLDIAFLKVEKNDAESSYDICKPVTIPNSDDTANSLTSGTNVYVYNSITGITHAGSIASSSIYSEDFGMDLICCYLKADPGMSGCALFDSDLHFLGMLLGGTDDGKSVYISSDIITSYDRHSQTS